MYANSWKKFKTFFFVASIVFGFSSNVFAQDVTAQSTEAGIMTNYTFDLTIAGTLDSAATFTAVFPSGFDASNVIIATSSTMDGGFDVTFASTTTVNFKRDETGTDATGAGHNVIIGVVKNPTATGVTGTIVLSGSASANGTVTITAGSLTKLEIRDTAGGGGSVLTSWSMTADDSKTYHAHGYDQFNNDLGDQSATWSSTGTLAPTVSETATSTTFSPTTAPAEGGIIATSGSVTASVAVTVSVGAVNTIEIVDDGGTALGTQNITTDDDLALYAKAQDIDSNDIGFVSVTWSSSGLTPSVSGSGTSTTFSPTDDSNGTITATHPNDTDQITVNVSVGALAKLRLRSAANNGGSELTAQAMVIGSSLQMFAAGYDLDDNYIADQAGASWGTSGDLTPTVTGTGTEKTFTPTTAPASGTITATASGNSASVGITVSQGTVASILIRDQSGGLGNEVGTVAMTTDDSRTFYAAGYDAQSNFVSDVTVTWSSTGLTPPAGGSSSSFTFSPTTAPASGTLSADDGSGHTDDTGTITVTVGVLAKLRLRNAANNGGSELTAQAMVIGNSLQMFAAGYDLDDNYIADQAGASWGTSGDLTPTVTGTGTEKTFTPTTAPASGTITATASGNSASVGITVSQGTVASILIRDQSGGLGNEVGTVAMTTDDSRTFYAAGYDAQSNFVSDVTVTWSSTGLTPPAGGSSSSFTFSPTTAPASGTLSADDGSGHTDDTGTITVTVGDPTRIKILSESSGEKLEVTSVVMTPEETLPVHASSFDAENNYIEDVNVNWSVSGDIGTLSNSSGSSTVLTATTKGFGLIAAVHASLIGDVTGTIEVQAGNLNHVLIMTKSGGPPAGALEFGNITITADDSITLYAAGFDAGDTYLGDANVNWSSTGLDPVVNASDISSVVFSPVQAPKFGLISVTVVGAQGDQTGTISVKPGNPTGTIELTATPPVLPADNTSKSIIQSNVIRDNDLNPIEAGTLVTVATDLGTITNPQDLDPLLPDIQIAANSSGIISFP